MVHFTVSVSENSLNAPAAYIKKIIAEGSKVFIVCDENTQQHCLPVLKKAIANPENILVVSLPVGEKNKTLLQVEKICTFLLQNQADRNAVLVNLGGGVLCDTGGFAASCFKRGIKFINIPTTLLAMTDAAVGGKTGVNLNGYKNQIGSFYLPDAVFIYTPFLNTLSKTELQNGFAEMFKHGLIADAVFFESLTEHRNFTSASALEKSIAIKTKIASADLNETGLRKLLNFGHTIGHALESWSQKFAGSELTHGQAVAAGIICESFVSGKLLSLSEKEIKKISNAVLDFFPKINHAFTIDDLMPYLVADKKNESGKINFTLLESIGKARINCFADKKIIEDAVNLYNKL